MATQDFTMVAQVPGFVTDFTFELLSNDDVVVTCYVESPDESMFQVPVPAVQRMHEGDATC